MIAPDSLVDASRMPLVVIVDEDGHAHITGNGAACPRRVAEWLDVLAEVARRRSEAEPCECDHDGSS